jgi:hypothetical protein
MNKNNKYVKYEFAIELSKKDIQLLYKIKSMLSVGSITFRTRGGRKKALLFSLSPLHFARLKISSKKDLILNLVY